MVRREPEPGLDPSKVLGAPLGPASQSSAKTSRNVLTVAHDGHTVSRVMNFYFRDEVLPYYGGGSAEYLKCGPVEDDYHWAITEMIDEATKEVPELPSVREREAIEMLNSLRHPKDENEDKQNDRR